MCTVRCGFKDSLLLFRRKSRINESYNEFWSVSGRISRLLLAFGQHSRFDFDQRGRLQNA